MSLFTPARRLFSVEQIGAWSRALGAWGPLLLFLLGLLTPLLLLPRWPIAFVAGLLYGISGGAVLANVASTAGAWLHFLVARSLLAPASARLLRRYGMDRLEIPRERVFLALFFLRAFPLSSFVATNLLAGSLRVPLRTYLAATFVGMIPSTLMYAAWGKMVKRPSPAFFAVAVLTLLFLVGGTIAAQRRFLPWLRGLRKTEPGPGEDGGGSEPARRKP